MPCDLKGHWTDLNPFDRPPGGSKLFALPINGNKFKKRKLEIMRKRVCPVIKKR